MPHHPHVSRTTPPPAYSALLFGGICARIMFFAESLVSTWTFLQPDVSGPFSLCCLSLSKAPQQGPSQDFWPDEKSLPRNYSCLSPPQISVKTRRQQMHHCVGCWWEARRKRTPVGAHPHRSAVVYLKQAGRRYYRRPRSTYTCTFSHIHIPIDLQSFTAQPMILARLVCVARLLPPHFTTTV